MSIHGTQRRLPFNLNATSRRELPYDAAIASNFATILSRVQDGEKILSFSEIMWPFIFISAEPNRHVMIDDVGINNLSLKIINAPRTAQVGHVLRDPNIDKIPKLQLCQRIIQFQEKIKLENEKEEINTDEELVLREINGLVNPKLTEGIIQVIPMNSEFQMSDFGSLESVFSFDDALHFAKKFIEIIETCRGNQLRWKTLLKLIEEPVDRWNTDNIVDIKDCEERYKSRLQKANEIDDRSIVNTLDSAKDNMDQWVLREQKNIIGKIGKMFVGIDLILEDVRKRNKFFLDTESLKVNDINVVIQRAFQQVAFIRTSLTESTQKLEDLSSRLNNIREEVGSTSSSAEEKIKKLNSDLLDKKQEQEDLIKQIQNEKENEIGKLKEFNDQIQKLWQDISNIIKKKIEDAKYDEESIRRWQMEDNLTQINAPTIRFYLPIGVGLIQDEDDEERIEIVLPAYIGKDLVRTALCPESQKFEKDTIKFLDKNMKIRSNFEFTLEKKNIKNDPAMKNGIKRGLEMLTKEAFIAADKKQSILNALEKI